MAWSVCKTFSEPTSEEVDSFIADFTIINFPSLKMDPNIMEPIMKQRLL